MKDERSGAAMEETQQEGKAMPEKGTDREHRERNGIWKGKGKNKEESRPPVKTAQRDGEESRVSWVLNRLYIY